MTKYNDEELEGQLANLKYKGRFIKNWFSNFIPCVMTIDGREWPDVETYFAAQKTLDMTQQEAIRLAKEPGEAKRLGRRVTLRRDWEKVKEGVMEKALRIKFAKGTRFHKQLLASKGLIIEWNNWGDQYWGMTLDKVGKNRLGEILMKIRDESKIEKDGDDIVQ